MSCKKILSFFCFLALISCCGNNKKISTMVNNQQEKLRKHFLYGGTQEDISSLIAETKAVASKLRKAGMEEKARKFDSYVDVLMFGNNTIDESINDVMNLTKNNYHHKHSECGSFKEVFNDLFCNWW